MTIFPSKKATNNSPMPRLRTPEPIPSTEKYSNPPAKQVNKGKQTHIERNKFKKGEKKEGNMISNSEMSQFYFEQSE